MLRSKRSCRGCSCRGQAATSNSPRSPTVSLYMVGKHLVYAFISRYDKVMQHSKIFCRRRWCRPLSSEEGNMFPLEGSKASYMKATASIGSWLSYVCHVCSSAALREPRVAFSSSRFWLKVEGVEFGARRPAQLRKPEYAYLVCR